MPKHILDIDKEILKMLVFDPNSDAVRLKIDGKRPGNYLVTPIEALDQALKNCHPDHADALLDARNYLYKKDASNVS